MPPRGRRSLVAAPPALRGLTALDGTPAHHAPGELPTDADEGKVMCGLCGAWFIALPPHLRLAHDWTAEEYRAAFGLNAQRALQAPARSERQAALLRARLDEPAIREGMRRGLALARSGDLNRMGRAADRERGRALQRQQRTRRQGHGLGIARAERHRREREDRARELGYSDLADYLSGRYKREDATVAAIATELGAHESAVIADMDRLGIARRPQDERLAEGRAALAAQRTSRRAELERRVAALSFESVEGYLRERLHERRWQRADVAAELGLTVPAVARLMRRERVSGVRGSPPADAAHREGYGGRRLTGAQSALAAMRAERDRELAAAHGFDELSELYATWSAEGLSDRAIAARMGVGEKVARRLRRQAGQPPTS